LRESLICISLRLNFKLLDKGSKLKIKNAFFTVSLLIVAVVLVSCDSSDDSSNGTTNPTEGTDQVRSLFTDSVQTVIEQSCVSCHSGKHASGGVFDYSDLDKAIASAAKIEARVSNGTMPPPNSSQAQQFTDEQKNLVVRWSQLAQQ